MKFIVKKSEIINSLANIQGLTGRKSRLAITENIMIQVEASEISFIATDLETGFKGRYPAAIESEGIIAINSKKFFEIIRNFPKDDVIVNEVENRWIEIGNENIEYHIVGVNHDDFPVEKAIEDVPFFEIDSVAFKKMIERTIIIGFGKEEKRAHILGVNFEKITNNDNFIVRLVATDAKRLSKVDCIFDKEAQLPDFKNFIIPKTGLIEINKFLDSTGKVQIGFKDNCFILNKENETVLVNLLEGEFPDYSKLINFEDSHALTFDKQFFLKMVKRMSILSSDEYKSIILFFDENRLVITATNPEIGESKEEMDIDFSYTPIQAAFNPRYIIDALNAVEDETIVLYIKDGQSPCMIEGIFDKSFLSVIMPMRI